MTAFPLELGLGARIAPLIAGLSSPLSEYSFANLFLFRHVHHYRFVEGPIPHVTGITYDGARHAMPLAALDEAQTGTLLGSVDCLYPVEEKRAAALQAEGYTAAFNDDDSDYVYDAARLAELAGPVLKTKRTQAIAFARDADPVLEALTDANRDQALTLLDQWLADVGRPREATDYAVCREALLLRAELGLDGLLVSLPAGEPLALLMMGPPRGDTRVVHFAKARRSYPGAHPWAVAQLAAAAGVSYLNFEQDLGHAGFRQAKRAFDPVTRLRKYRMSRKGVKV